MISVDCEHIKWQVQVTDGSWEFLDEWEQLVLTA